jgi:hypothetical protein
MVGKCGMDLFMAQVRVQWWTPVATAINLRVPKRRGMS